MEWIDFLLRAKKGTYAAGGGSEDRLLDDGGRQMSYREGDYLYRDCYYGWDPFVGEEVVLKENHVIWSMNYYGFLQGEAVAGEAVAGEAVYGFLVKALKQSSPERPYRGPLCWQEEEWQYTSCSEGTLEGFEGEEQIFWRGQPVYRLVFHGGRVGPHR